MLILFDYVTILTQNLGINPRGCLDNSYDGPEACTLPLTQCSSYVAI